MIRMCGGAHGKILLSEGTINLPLLARSSVTHTAELCLTEN